MQPLGHIQTMVVTKSTTPSSSHKHPQLLTVFPTSPWTRIAELERHLQDLRQSLQTAPSQQADDSPSETAPPLSGSEVGPEDAQVLQCASQLAISDGIEVPAMSLGDIIIPPEEFLTCVEL